ncbi:YgiQ family radical SAM protein [Kaarinaea lacus]
METAKNIFSYRKYWAKRFGVAPYLPTGREEMDELGWDSCDIVLVTGDAYVDHPSFGMAVVGRTLEAQGFRVGIITQPDWTSTEDFTQLGKPNLFFGVTAGNMDSMVNRYTADRKMRSDDAYSPNGAGGRRPDRSVIVYSQRCREAFNDVPIVIGGIEASLRRIAQYDYWSDKVRRSVIFDARADLLVYGNGERQVVEIAHRLAANETIDKLTDIRGTAFIRKAIPESWEVIDSTDTNVSQPTLQKNNPYAVNSECEKPKAANTDVLVTLTAGRKKNAKHNPHAVIRMPAYNKVKAHPHLYAHASRILHKETNPGNAKALFQSHGDRGVWINPPAWPLTTKELDSVFELPYSRKPHPKYGEANIPAYEMIRFSVNIMRGCFGGCTFCSITEHEGRIIQSRSQDSILKEIATIRDQVPGFTGIISDLGGPTANMYRLACKSKEIEQSCRRLSCVFPGICKNLNTDHQPLIKLYRKARELPGIKKVFIASGLRYDLAVQSPEYVKELVSHHVGGYLKIAPEHTEAGPLSKMMKPGMDSYYRFKQMFDEYSKAAGKEQYLIPYFIAAHPGTRDEDMMQLALWLKQNGFRADQVQTFLPSPMATATAMYFSGKNPLHKISKNSETVHIPKGLKNRRLHKAFLRYHDPNNWPLLRDALKRMGRSDLIGNGKKHLIPKWQPAGTGSQNEGRRHSQSTAPGKSFRTQHSGEIPNAAKRKKSAAKPFNRKRGKNA